jgi:bifunctional DNase/RNase
MNESDLIEVEVIGFSPAQQPGGFVVFLKEKGHTRCLPIVVGAAEAQAISIILNPEPTERPMTYDTFGNIIDSLCGTVKRIVVRKLENNTFYADIWLINSTGDNFHLDARPSDAIAFALKMNAPIYVLSQVMKIAGIEVPEELLQAGKQSVQSHALRKLNTSLQEAIENEDYEEAARLRDKIRRLKEEQEKQDEEEE